MEESEFKIERENGITVIERKYNISFIISNWISQNEINKHFSYIEKKTNNFEYITYQKSLNILIKFLFFIGMILFIILYFNSTKVILCYVESVIITSLLFLFAIKYLYKNVGEERFYSLIYKSLIEVNTFLKIKGLTLSFQKNKNTFYLDYIK